jgi:hypothetical protein
LELEILVVIDVGEELDGVGAVFAEEGKFGLSFFDLSVVGLCDQVEGLVEFVVTHSITGFLSKL